MTGHSSSQLWSPSKAEEEWGWLSLVPHSHTPTGGVFIYHCVGEARQGMKPLKLDQVARAVVMASLARIQKLTLAVATKQAGLDRLLVRVGPVPGEGPSQCTPSLNGKSHRHLGWVTVLQMPV